MLLLATLAATATGLAFRNIYIFSVGFIGLLLFLYPAQTIAVLTALYIIYSLIKDKLP